MRRLTSIRCYIPHPEKRSAAEIKKIWQKKLASTKTPELSWLYLHLPYCPQSCKYCQCCRTQLDNGKVPEKYLSYLKDEMQFFSPLFKKHQFRTNYIGGGSPNLLTDNQLSNLLDTVESNFNFTPKARKTFEFLASIFRPEPFVILRKHGYNRLSCGIQSQNEDTLKAEHRSSRNMNKIGEIIEYAFEIGFDEFNLDLMWGLEKDNEETFVKSLLDTLAFNPTTVSIHMIIPTETNFVFGGLVEEMNATKSFYNLKNRLQEITKADFPEYEWFYRPNIWVLAKKDFLLSDRFSLEYYSDNERIHDDMLAVGQFGYSHIIGEMNISNNNETLEFNPEAKDYKTFKLNYSLEAAMDLITDLASDYVSDLSMLEKRYPDESLTPVGDILEELKEQNVVRVNGSTCFYNAKADAVFIDDLWPLIERTTEIPQQNIKSTKKDFATSLPNYIKVSDGKQNIMVTVEKVMEGRKYYEEFKNYGLLYANEPHLTDEDYNQVLSSILPVIDEIVQNNPQADASKIMELLSRYAPPV